jgi:hypothetical protein
LRLAERVRPFIDFATRATAVVFVHDDEVLAHLALEVDLDVLVSVNTAAATECIVLESGRDALVSVDTAAEVELCVLQLRRCIAPARLSPWPRTTSCRPQRPSVLHAAHGPRAHAAVGLPTLTGLGHPRRHVSAAHVPDPS